MDELKRYNNPKSKNKDEYIRIIYTAKGLRPILFICCLFFTGLMLVFLWVGGVGGYLLTLITFLFIAPAYACLVFPKSTYTKISAEGIIYKSLWTLFKEFNIPWEKINFFYENELKTHIYIKFEEGVKLNLFEKNFNFLRDKNLKDFLNSSLDKYKKNK